MYYFPSGVYFTPAYQVVQNQSTEGKAYRQKNGSVHTFSKEGDPASGVARI